MVNKIYFRYLLLLPVIFWSCASGPAVDPMEMAPGPHAEQQKEFGQTTPPQEPQKVLTGLDVLIKIGFEPLMGQTVGVITNHTAVSKLAYFLQGFFKNNKGLF